MTEKIRVGIVGYGNIGKGAEMAIAHNPDFELVAIFTRRQPEPDTKQVSVSEAVNYVDKIDLMLMCGGSASDLPVQVPEFVKLFNTIDTFDTHAKIPEYFARVDEVARQSGHLAMISTGWDPGLFSLARVLMEAVLPTGRDYTFWGRGVSQGHSDAARRIPGVKDARQYTVPREAVLKEIRLGGTKEYSPRDMHTREVFVLLKEGADPEKIEWEIKNMPNYFEPYDTFVHFVDEETMKREHHAMPHGGWVVRSGITGGYTREIMEFRLKLDSNPEFTSSAMLAFARAAYRMAREGRVGCCTVYDVPLGYLLPADMDFLRREKL